MPHTDRKQKMISLRLSDSEYESLKTHYRTYGARNMSELTRLALQRIVTGAAGPQDDFAGKLSELDARLHQVEDKVSHLLDPESVLS
jgi:hypothetical protein